MENVENPEVGIKEDTISTYKRTVMDRVRQLPDEEKQILQDFSGTPAAQVFSKILPELVGVSEAVTMQEELPQEQLPLPLENQMKRAGLGAR